MIRFVDINTGNVFDGSAPYIHWFDGVQSVGINYSKKFILLSDSTKIKISLENSVFQLVDDTKLDTFVTKHNKQYLDLSTITSKEIELTGTAHQGLYVYSFNIIAKGLYVGEVQEDFFIDGEKFTVGADFVDENESLSTLLTNFGMDMPNEIQRAFYVQNIHEQKPDYILLNRKYKELLNEYINIIANKGSYKSLINSLKWFEYGDLVKIYEYWRHQEPTRKMLNKNDITQYISDRIENILSSFQKTTYISLCCALTNYKLENGNIVYIKETGAHMKAEPNPAVENVSMLWSRTEMSLKMVLLGNFFATFFMPIHLDLIHCSVEDVVYTDTIKTVAMAKKERNDFINNMKTITCKIEKEHHLDNIETIINSDEKFIITEGDNTNPWLFKGIGAVVPVHCVLHDVSKNDYITFGKLYLYRDGYTICEKEIYNITHNSDKNNIDIDFKLFVENIGNYTLTMVFYSTDGCMYTKTVQFTVDSERFQNVYMYKMVPRYTSYDDCVNNFDISKWMQEKGDDVLNIDNVSDYVLDPVSQDGARTYMQFFAANGETISNSVKTNQLLIVCKKGEHDISDFETEIISIDNESVSINVACKDAKYKYLKFFVTTKYTTIKDFENSKGPKETYLFCINVSDKEIGIGTRKNGEKAMLRNVFVPYLYKLERFGEISLVDKIKNQMTEEQLYKYQNDTSMYTIDKNDVVCFLPDLRCIKRPSEFMWQFKCQSTDEVIRPITLRDYKNYNNPDVMVPTDNISKSMPKDYPAIIQPIFGRYDFSILPSAGYYDVTINYKLDDKEENQTRSISSQFIVKK